MYLDYTGIRVTDLDRSLQFYSEAVGLREIRRGTMDHGGVWVLLQDPISHQHLELNWYPEGNRYAVPFALGEGLDHLGFRVENIVAAAKRLTDAGAHEVDRFEENGSPVVIYLTDPDGHWLELIAHPTES